MEYIQSAKNPFVKTIKKLEKKKYRTELGQYLIEGEHLVEEALRYQGDLLQCLIVTPLGESNFQALLARAADVRQVCLSESAFKTISAVPATQGIIAVMSLPRLTVETHFSGPILLLDHVQDPGNVGTMVRTADAAGFTAVVLGEGCADIYNDKVMRAMQGSHFHLPIYQTELAPLIERLKKQDYHIYGTQLHETARDYRTVDYPAQTALIMGNEGQGVSAELLALVDHRLIIPMKGQAESLNVAVAAGILMFSMSQ